MKYRIIALILVILLSLYAASGCSKNIIDNSFNQDSENNETNGNTSNSNGTQSDATQSDDTQSDATDPPKNDIVKKELDVSIIKTTDIDKLLERPYTYGVPTAFSEGLFSTYSEGWGFKNETVLATGNASGFGMPIDIKINDLSVMPTDAIWMPSHVTSIFDSSKNFVNIASEATVSASYTSQYDKDGIAHLTDGVISYSDEPRSRWSNYVNPIRTQNEIITFDFGKTVTCAYLTVYFYDDGGNTQIPKSAAVEYYNGSSWVPMKNQLCGSIVKASGVDIKFDEVSTTAIRLVLTPNVNKAMGITEIRVFGKSDTTSVIPDGVTVEEKKFITENDVVVSRIYLKNTTNSKVSFKISATPNKGNGEEKFGYRYILFGGDISAEAGEFSLNSGESRECKLMVAVADSKGECQNKINAIKAQKDCVGKHVEQFNLWFEKNIPYFDCSDKELLQIYYFRWLVYRNNVRKITDEWNGYIISEFLPNVAWAGLYNSISCPAGHHFYEGRWIRNEKYLDAYSEFWFIDGANPRLYSFPIADAYYNRYLVTGDKEELVKYLDELEANYEAWEKSHYVSSLGLYKQIADRDGMENGIGGDGVRPTINSYMYGDAIAIYKMALMVQNASIADEYKIKAEKIQKNVMEKLWNENESFFETISVDGKSVNVRELIGYVPWYFNLPADDVKYSAAFSQLLDKQGFSAPYGPTTAEQRDAAFMSKLRPGCRWDGPSWPFATAQTLTASANLLNNYMRNNSFDKGNWFELLKTYTVSQYKNGYPWLAENIHPLTGEWIVDYDRSIHYNHSSYTDIVITGLAGIRPDDSDDVLVVNPLFEKGDLKYFMLENVRYRGHDITVIYDENGSRYGHGTGLMVYVDGELSASSKNITKLNVNLK